MVTYRRRLSIIADILKAANKVGKKTRIMYLANLSYALLQKYLSETITIGLIDSNNNSYEVTEKGHEFLEKYKRYERRYSRVQKTVHKLMVERRDLEKMCRKCVQNANPNQKLRRESRNEKQI